MGKKLSIDFGTTNTVVSEWIENEQKPRTLRFAKISTAETQLMPSVIPSILYIDNETRMDCKIGNEVISNGLDIKANDRFFSGFKRLIVSSNNVFPRKINDKRFEYRTIGELFLEKVLKEIAKISNEKATDNEIVFTAPVESFEAYYNWLMEISRKYIPNYKVRIMDESTAAAIGYGVTKANELILVVDFGGGTLDISLIKTPSSIRDMKEKDNEEVKVIAKGGEILGGEDIDNWILEDILKENSLKIEEAIGIYTQLKHEVEELKKQLSIKTEEEFSFFDVDSFNTISSNYTRERFEDLLLEHDFYTCIQNVIDRVLDQARLKGISKDMISKVLLVGGTCLIPSVQRSIKQVFGSSKVHSEKTFEAVSNGALLLLQGINVEDYICHSYAIRYLNPNTNMHDYKILFPSGTKYPTDNNVELNLGCSNYNQMAIELVIAEIQQKINKTTEVFFDGQTIKTVETEGNTNNIRILNEDKEKTVLARLNPPGNPGNNRLNVIFKINNKKQLISTVKDVHTSKIIYSDIPVVNLN